MRYGFGKATSPTTSSPPHRADSEPSYAPSRRGRWTTSGVSHEGRLPPAVHRTFRGPPSACAVPAPDRRWTSGRAQRREHRTPGSGRPYGVRQPRTMAGLDAKGRLILATVDGQQPGVSEGFTLEEAARFTRSLGASQDLNLDGGGSTAMAVNGKLANTTSDATGEHAVGDTVQVPP
ncbi:phosphodiester glycosidase family protein [Streptomyces javensis]|uniref:phosphodiester glycosidase family protein n=1 Tax=Streptomyces javensis TaxID=114698 RepID=UPI0033F18C58